MTAADPTAQARQDKGIKGSMKTAVTCAARSTQFTQQAPEAFVAAQLAVTTNSAMSRQQFDLHSSRP